MELKRSSVAVHTLLSVLIVFSLHQHAEAQMLCPSETDVVAVKENNTIGSIVTTVNAAEGVKLTVTTNPMDAFTMEGQNLVTTKVLDYENLPPDGPGLTVVISCEKSSSIISCQFRVNGRVWSRTQPTETMRVIVVVEDVNDNPPVFEKSHFTISVNELTPKGTSVTRVEAKDLDSSVLYYRLEPEVDAYFTLESSTIPNILVAKDLDYDVIRRETLVIHVQDFPEAGLDVFSSSATITINIVDIDNRPPWFQPCTEMMVDLAKICISSGYRGTVNLTEQASGPLMLQPGPVYAVDGDTSRNEAIGYSIIGGNEDGIFDIGPNNGNITMLKAADVPGPIILSVLAAQVVNSDQFATTTVVFTVVKRSKHPPKFAKQRYDGYISSNSELGSMVLERKSQRPLRVQATDEDFANGINPDMVFEVPDSGDFTVTAEGFVLSKRDVTPGTVDFQIRAVDFSNGETDTTTVSVEVLPGTTTAEPNTDMPTTGTGAESTSPAGTTTAEFSTDMPPAGSSSSPSVSSPIPSGEPTSTTQEGAAVPMGAYRMEDMAALGASLAAVVLLCLVIIGLLVFRIRKGKADWQKLTEATMFRSAFARGSAGPKEGLEYTNDGFQNDGDTGSLSKVPQEIDLRLDTMTAAKAKEASSPEKTTPVTSQSQFNTFLHDTGSLAGSEKADSEKEVKPILTKERRNEDGYKSVWFKEDIDPSAKEEVVIIPDNGEQEDDEDEDSFDDGEGSPVAVPKVMFADGQKDEKKADKNTASAVEEEDGMDL